MVINAQQLIAAELGAEVGDTSCHPSYPDNCISPPPPNLNCDDVDATSFEVVGSDPHGFDGDNDGIGCESARPVPIIIPWELFASIILSPIVGWSIPSIIDWARSKRDIGKLNYYHKQIASLYGDGKLDENDIEGLDRLRSRVLDEYLKGRLNEKHSESLRDEISILYGKIFRKRLGDALNNDNKANKNAIQEQIAQIKTDIEYAYSEGKINEKHYNLLNKAILNLDGKGRDNIP